jgi:hypothetical protein
VLFIVQQAELHIFALQSSIQLAQGREGWPKMRALW